MSHTIEHASQIRLEMWAEHDEAAMMHRS